MKLLDRLLGRPRKIVPDFGPSPCGMIDIAQVTIRSRSAKISYTPEQRQQILDGAREIGLNWRLYTVDGAINALTDVFRRVEASTDVMSALA